MSLKFLHVLFKDLSVHFSPSLCFLSFQGLLLKHVLPTMD